METVQIRDPGWKKVGSGINIPDPQHWNDEGREMENIGRDPTFGDFVTIRTEASMQDVTVARLQSTRVQTPLSPPL